MTTFLKFWHLLSNISCSLSARLTASQKSVTLFSRKQNLPSELLKIRILVVAGGVFVLGFFLASVVIDAEG